MSATGTTETRIADLDPIYMKRVDESYCEKIARVFSRDYGITVRFGAGAYTDAEGHITLPAMFCERWIMDGTIDHEGGHERREAKCERERRDGWKASVEKAKALAKSDSRYKPLPVLLNAVEDVSIESEDGERWTGVAANLHRARAFFIDRLEKEARGLSFADAIGKAFIAEAMGPSMLDSTNESLASAARWVHEHVETFLSAARAARFTDESFAIAKAICEALAEKKDEASRLTPPEPEGEKSEDGDGAGAPEDGDEGSDGSGSEDEDGSPENDEKAPGSSGEGDGDGDGDGDKGHDDDEAHAADTGASEGPEMTREEVDKFLDEMDAFESAATDEGTFERDIRALGETENREVYAADPRALAADRINVPPKNSTEYKYREEIANKITRVLMGKLRIALLSREDSTDYGLRKGKIHGPHLHRVAKFNTRVFKKDTSTTIGVDDTAVEILIDQSASMGGIMKETVSAVIALGKALDAIGIKFEIVGFTNLHPGVGRVHGVRYHRTLPFLFSVFKGFGESWTHVKERLGSANAISENADGEAVKFALDRLLTRKESRKILLVLSDGAPQCGGDDNAAIASHLKRTIEWAQKKNGVEVIGIGLGYSGVRHYYENAAVAKSINELPVKLDKALRKGLHK